MQLKWSKSGLKDPLSRARGLGSAKDGTHHWKMQRLTAIANVFLGVWFILSMLVLAMGSGGEASAYEMANGWLTQPINAILMILFVISAFMHAVLGAQIVTEDYVHNEGLKFIKLAGQRLIYFGLAVACIFSILKVAL